jgi:hypothetical protein
MLGVGLASTTVVNDAGLVEAQAPEVYPTVTVLVPVLIHWIVTVLLVELIDPDITL